MRLAVLGCFGLLTPAFPPASSSREDERFPHTVQQSATAEVSEAPSSLAACVCAPRHLLQTVTDDDGGAGHGRIWGQAVPPESQKDGLC